MCVVIETDGGWNTVRVLIDVRIDAVENVVFDAPRFSEGVVIPWIAGITSLSALIGVGHLF